MRTIFAISTALVLGGTLAACNREPAQAPHQQTQTVPAEPAVAPTPENDTAAPAVTEDETPG